MSFEIIEPGVWGNTLPPLKARKASIAHDGKLTLLASDLKRAGIEDAALVLADKATLRIGLRAPCEEERGRAARVAIVTKSKGADSGRRTVNLARAVKALGLELDKVRGRYELLAHGGNAERVELLIIPLVDLSKATPKAKK